MPENNANSILLDFLNDDDAVDSLIVARNRDNDLAKEGFGSDILNLPYNDLVRKYGVDVANQSYKVQTATERVYNTENAERSTGQVVGDTALSVGSGAVNTAGSLLALGLAGVGSVDNQNGENNTLNELSSNVLKTTEGISNIAKSLQSDELYKRKQLSEIESQLDEIDRQTQFEKDTETSGNYIATLKKVGNEVLDTGDRILNDSSVAGDIIAEAIGSLGPSAKIAGAGANLAAGTAAKITGNQGVNKLATTVGAASGVGVAEASGVFAQTVKAVEALSYDQLSEGSDEYIQLIENGLTPDEARAKVALDTGKEAFRRQLPTATALGLLTARFEAAPIGSFRGSGLLGGFRQIGSQALEEGAQGATGAYNQNIAVQNQADRDQDLSEGIGEELATGVIAGAGMSAVLAAPSVITPSVQAVKDVSETVSENLPDLDPILGKAKETVSDVIDSINPSLETIKDKVRQYNNTEDPDIKNDKVISAIKARDKALDIVEKAEELNEVSSIDPAVAKIIVPNENTTIPDRFTDAVSSTGSLIENTAGLLQKFQESDFKVDTLTDEEISFAVNEFNNLAKTANQLPDDLKADVINTLSSSDISKVFEKFKEIDLNKTQDENTEITSESVNTTLAVAKANPQNVNPGFVNKILNQDTTTTYTDSDIKNLEVARDVALTINEQIGNYVDISKDLNVQLSKKATYNGRSEALPPVLDPSTTSRSLLLEGYTDKRNKNLKSVLQLASEIQQGAQNPEGNFEFQSEDGFISNALDVGENLRLLTQHLSNKVGALNESAANQYGNGTGTKVGFTGLVAGSKMIQAGNDGAPEAVSVHTNSPKSIQFAKVVEADAIAAANVYNILQKAYPEILPGSAVVLPSLNISKIKNNNVETNNDTSNQNNNITPEQEALAEQSTDQLEQTETVDDIIQEVQEEISEETLTTEVDDVSEAIANETEQPSETQDTENERENLSENIEPTITDTVELSEKSIISDQKNVETIFTNTHKSVSTTFSIKTNDSKFTGFEDAINQITEISGTEDFLELFDDLKSQIGTHVQESLKTIKMSKKDDRSIIEGVGENQSFLNSPRFVSLSLLDQNTGEYNKEVLDAVLLSTAEWMSTARNAPTKSLKDILSEDLRITLDDISSKAEFNAIQNGLDIGTVVDEITSLSLDILNIQKNPKSTIVQYNGMIEGLVKTVLDSMTQELDSIAYGEVPIQVDGKIRKTSVLMFPGLPEIQSVMNRTSKGVLKRITSEGVKNFPNIGEKISNTRETQKRTNLKLSDKELAAVRSMEDTPYLKATGAVNFIRSMDKQALFERLGWKDIGKLSETHPLALSILGKNLSIERDYDEALQVVQEIEVTGSDETPAYFPIEVSKVSRHQMTGINPQSNKILRLLVTPTHSQLDLSNQEHMDALWVVIAQASGLYKVEKSNRNNILKNIENDFDKEFLTSVNETRRFLKEGQLLDMSKFPSELDTQQISAILTVAELRNAQEAGETTYNSTISFELDGITNGTANMMVNHGQYLISAKQFENFARVGLFIGDSSKTLNDYYQGTDNTGQKNKDIYEITSQGAQTEWFLNNKNYPKLSALTRLMTVLGDFKVNNDGNVEMTRNTSKNPTTKTVYKSGVSGIGSGIAEDFIIELYQGILGNEKLVYPNLPDFSMKEDLELALNYKFPKTIDKNSFRFPREITKEFSKYMSTTVGSALASAANEVIGEDIQTVNDIIVLYTQVQADYLKVLFEKTLTDIVQEKINKGLIKSKNDLTQNEYNDILNKVQKQAIVFSNGDQNLSIGSVAKSRAPRDGGTKFTLSTNLRESVKQETNMVRPSDAGVQAIPYITIGRGDGMMINNVASNPDGPKNSIMIFDGIDFSVLDYDKFSPAVNQGVWDAWSNNTLSDVLDSLNKFLTEADLKAVDQSFQNVRFNKFNKDNSFYALNNVNSIQDIHYLMEEFVLKNQARKNVLQQVPVAVHQMGGSLNTFNRLGSNDQSTMTYSEINRLIFDEYARLLETANVSVPEDRASREVFKPISEKVDDTALPILNQEKETQEPDIEVLTVGGIIDSIKKKTRSPDIRKVISIIENQINEHTKIIMGTLEELNKYREDNYSDDGQVLTKSGNMDTKNNVIYIEGSFNKDTQETIIHELVHAATFNKVLEHYEGTKNEAVDRLETLMQEFLDSKPSKSPDVKKAIAAILVYQSKTDAFSKAAAVNEFMAWALSNKALKTKLKATESKSFSQLAQKVVALMKRIIGSSVSDIYSGVVFNTQILDANVLPIDFNNGGSGNGNNNNREGDDGEITPSARKQTNFWIELIKERLDQTQNLEGKNRRRTEQTLRYIEASNNAVNKLEIGGFNFTQEQRDTFKAIHSVMAMETRLNTQSAVVLNKLFTYITDNLEPSMFGPVNSDERYNTVLNVFGSTKNDEDVSDSIAVLLALSQTSKGFRDALDQLPLPNDNENTQIVSLNDAFAKTVGFLMGKAVGTIETNDIAAKESLDALSENIIRQENDKEFYLLRGLMKGLNKADDYVSGKMSELSEGAFDVANRARNEDYPQIVQAATKGFAQASSFLNKERDDISKEGIKKILHMGQTLDNFVPVREFVSEVVGTDKINRNVMALLDRTNHAISYLRQAYREDLPVLLQDAFKNHPDADQWKQMHMVLAKTDFVELFTLSKPQASISLLADNNKLSNAINDSETVIKKNYTKKTADLIIEKSQQLGTFMVTGNPGTQLLRNAYAINKLTGEFNEAITPEINRLISLYAIQTTSKSDRDNIVEAYNNDAEAITNLIVYIKGLNKEEDEKIISETAKLNGYKGYIPDHTAPNTRIVIENDSKEGQLKKQGFVRVDDYVGSSEYSITKRGYYVTTVKQGGLYSQGVMQQVRDTYKGVDATTGLTVNSNVSGIIEGDEVNVINKEIDKGKITNSIDALIPVYDETGGVVSYERSINPNMQRTYFNRKSNLAIMLGSWAGRQVEERFAKAYNTELVDELKNIYDKRNTGDDDIFVNIADSKIKDPIFRDSWNVIPADTKSYIQEVFGQDTFYIRKDMANLAVGYREPSILDVWSGKTRLPEIVQQGSQAVSKLLMGDRAITILSRAEEFTQAAVSSVKDLIVVRSLVVPYMNTQANFIQLSTRGVPVKQIIKGYRDKLSEIETYNNNTSRIINLEHSIKLNADDQNKVKILETQIQTIKDENARMTISEVIESGAYKNISEGITDMDVELTSGRIGEWVEKQMNRLPTGTQTIVKYGLLSKDTELYKTANKMVQYGDFLAKSIMFDYLVQEKGIDKEQAISEINEEFVNFSFLPGRTRSYLESLGATWFMAFKIRIMKIAMKILRENPVRAMITAGTVGDLGSPVNDNLVNVIAQDRLDYALGWDMLWNAPELNPWVQAVDLTD